MEQPKPDSQINRCTTKWDTYCFHHFLESPTTKRVSTSKRGIGIFQDSSPEPYTQSLSKNLYFGSYCTSSFLKNHSKIIIKLLVIKHQSIEVIQFIVSSERISDVCIIVASTTRNMENENRSNEFPTLHSYEAKRTWQTVCLRFVCRSFQEKSSIEHVKILYI